ncbi:MAG: TetR/AcrR family transcriptional regulator [Syntrophomonas sp.]
MGKKPDANKEKVILEAAVKVINEKGFHAATTKEIAREAGVAEGTIFNYFPTKKDILHQISIKVVEQIIPSFVVDPFDEVLVKSKEKNPEEALRYILKNRIEFMAQNINLLKVAFTEFQHYPELRDIAHEKLFLPMRSKVKQYLQDGIDAGFFRDFDVSVVASIFLGMLLSILFWRQILMNDAVNGFDQDIDALVDILLRGIGKE